MKAREAESPARSHGYYVQHGRSLNIRRLGKVLPCFQFSECLLAFLANNGNCVGPQRQRTRPWLASGFVLSFHNVHYPLDAFHSIAELVSVKIVKTLGYNLRNDSVVFKLGDGSAARGLVEKLRAEGARFNDKRFDSNWF